MEQVIEKILKEYGASDYMELAENVYCFETSDKDYKFSIETEDGEANVLVEILINEDWQADKEFTYEV